MAKSDRLDAASHSSASQLIGFLNLNKPKGMTSHDVVAKVRRLVRMKYIGHGGTLDPMAQGVLPLALGSACRLLRYVTGGKTYEARILLGESRTTDDIEGEVIEQSDRIPEEQIIRAALNEFTGDLLQVPPAFSAVHHEGKRLYELARQSSGAAVAALLNDGSIPARKVHVAQIDVLGYNKPTLMLRIRCGSGTYIRSIARDLGFRLGCGGCLSGLIREQSGPFELAQSTTLEELERAAQEGTVAELLATPQAVLSKNPSLLHLEIEPDLARRIGMGQRVTHPDAAAVTSCEQRILVTSGSQFLAVCELESNYLHAEVVLNMS